MLGLLGLLGVSSISSGKGVEQQQETIISSTSRAANEPAQRPTEKMIQKAHLELKHGMLLGTGGYGYNGPGQDSKRVPSETLTTAVDTLIVREPVLTSCQALVKSEASNFKKHGFLAPFMASQNIMGFAGLRPFLGELEHKYSCCMLHLNEIKLYTFSRVGYIMSVPVLIPIESEVFKAGERLRELSEALNSSRAPFQPYSWVANQNKQIKELNAIFDRSIEKILNLRFEISIVDVKKRITANVRFIALQYINETHIPLFNTIGDPDLTTPLLNEQEEKTVVTLFVDFVRRSLSEYHWRSSHPGSFYERTPFVSPNVTNSDLVPRTFTERTNLIRQELVKTSFATFGATGEKWIDFCRTCAFHFNPVTRAAYQLQAHTTAEALQAAAFQAAQAALAPGLLGVNPPSTVEQTPQKSLPVDGIEVTPGGKAGAVVLTHLKRGGDARRILSWSVDASNMQSVAPSSQVASDRLRFVESTNRLMKLLSNCWRVQQLTKRLTTLNWPEKPVMLN